VKTCYGLVIPCYNEAARLPIEQIDALMTNRENLSVLLVDDGSKDKTAEVLHQISNRHPRVHVKILTKNGGKAEAVRQGLLQLLAEGNEWVGYADADFATPAKELLRLMDVCSRENVLFVLGSRVRLLGYYIQRRAVRHYLGRVFATFASIALKLPVYDTQCGAKFFRATNVFKAAVEKPFQSMWAFDVELLGRLLRTPEYRDERYLREVPLLEWRDVPGSKLKPSSMVKAGLDVILIGWRLRREGPGPNLTWANGVSQSALPANPDKLLLEQGPI
jgi:dolichyl-phosphate beta-glucosyltransferase